MKIRSSENCVRGVRFSYVYNATVSLVALPRSGRVTVVGPGFSYTVKSNFHGEGFVRCSVGLKQYEWVFNYSRTGLDY